MRLEIIDDDIYKVFINGLYTNDIDLNNKETLGNYIKEIILKLKKIYNIKLQGLYEVHVYNIKFIGMILEIKNIDNYFGKSVDLKIIVHNDEEIYLRITNYELIEDYKNVKYVNNYFFLNIDSLDKEDIYNLVENYSIVYGDDLTFLKSKWVDLT